jgi:hypothetical protein
MHREHNTLLNMEENTWVTLLLIRKVALQVFMEQQITIILLNSRNKAQTTNTRTDQ